MYILIIFMFLCLFIFSIYTIYKLLELEKDVNTLYDKYAKELEKNMKININLRGMKNV